MLSRTAGLQAQTVMDHLEAGTKSVEPGLCDSPPHVDHRLSIHVGSPVASVRWEGRQKHRYVRTPGGINIVPAGAQSRWWIESPMQQMHVRVPHASFALAAQDLGLDPARVLLDQHYQVRDARIEHIGHAMQLEIMEGNPNGRLFLDSLNVALCVRLIHEFSHRAPIATPRRFALGPLQLLHVIEYIDEHLASPLTLQELARVAGTSVSYFKMAFKQTFGTPVHRYVVERRVERAAQLLAKGESISSVAAEVGFAHASHMARWMQRLLRSTPSELKRRKS
jgi:AraC family transcriptional regulator